MEITTDSQVITRNNDDFKDLKKYKPQSVNTRKLKDGFERYVGKNKGVIYIFNHTEYHESMKLNSREGTHHDVTSLINVYTKLGFEIKRSYRTSNELEVFNDCKHKEIINVLKNAKDEDYESIGVIVMSHGKLDKIAAYDSWYHEAELFDALKGKFENKFKFFIIQACRNESGSKNKFLLNLPRTDMCVLHSAYPETVSNRDKENGTYLIQIFCKRLSIINGERDFLDEMTFVKKDVADWTNGNQMPIISHSMTRHFFISPCHNKMKMEFKHSAD